ncbi:MAG: MBL fold metallo-hydrolase, partial [Clostridiales bacterium]|nr:MBL fold metallo-hydrolase [Clostridiales bacterium]
MTGPDRIVPLYSSSSGNATLIKCRGTYILVDCGMSCKMMTKALVDSGVYPDDVAAIFLTHRHTDHVNGVPVFSRKYHTPIYGTKATLAVLDGLASEVTEIEENDIVTLENGPEVRAFPTPHDVNGSVCYRIFNQDTGNS